MSEEEKWRPRRKEDEKVEMKKNRQTQKKLIQYGNGREGR
jgi:hypothetical protein